MRMGADCGGSGRKRRASSSRNQDQNRSPQIEEQVVVRRKTRYSTLLGLQCGHGTVGGTADEALTVRDFNIDAKNLLEEPVDKYAELRCESCGRDDNDAEMILCDRCDAGFHIYCLRPIVASVPAEDWFCSSCTAPPKIREFPKVQTKIVDFFRIEKFLGVPETKKRRRHSGGLTVSKRSRKLVVHTPSNDQDRLLEQMRSLATALTTVNIAYSDDLTYPPGCATRECNRPSLEIGGMQEMSKDDKAAFDLSKRMWKEGHVAPLVVKHDSREGFVVEADSPIKDMTIVAEYTGDVDYMKNRKHDGGNSIMGLLFTADPSKELVICPDKRGNIARFISGINNHTREGKRKQNLRCVRYNVDGEARALLIAIRDIPKGERLYYDYNAYLSDYPTKHFV
ncbi:[histone H3]-lysine27 N-methyltransferase [Marchantia polymorpha subsp. ruderalis]|uniref:Histone-lysine N-methyltransferase n=2 Tax=Marchantia polymorpha TaxID=3197 RepID=A0AAF6BEM9_MARPO|nr:hypothetical protein MARPO_0133s0013 [Marchantia polymorpha]BBN10463.1 hypothetical protein Mp_5g03760 [Marchantia polymorpha subsp. ruderalis]|eukprot:PTQ29863.1 hypothetical protein MARPO_0133s0013 [Marchantia polymorpha]